ncbi:MAG: translation elongation factor Ts [Terriglobia bacterium]
MVKPEQIKELRGATGAGVMDCKKALVETDGDFDAAVKVLRQKGWSRLEGRSDRETKEGLVESYIHPGGRIGVLVEVSCETDFVARNVDFQEFVHDLALHIAASRPLVIAADGAEGDFEKEDCLLEQPFVKDPNVLIKDCLADVASKIGEKIVIKRFTRYELGQD